MNFAKIFNEMNSRKNNRRQNHSKNIWVCCTTLTAHLILRNNTKESKSEKERNNGTYCKTIWN